MGYVYEFANQRKLTKREFIKWFEKKFFYTIRRFKMVNEGDLIRYSRKSNFRDVVLRHLLNIFVLKFPIKLTNFSNKKTKLALSDTTDIVASNIIERVFRGNFSKLRIMPVERGFIRPLYLFLDKEVLLYAKLMNLDFKKERKKISNLHNFINELESKHPEIKHSIVKSYLELI